MVFILQSGRPSESDTGTGGPVSRAVRLNWDAEDLNVMSAQVPIWYRARNQPGQMDDRPASPRDAALPWK